MVIEMWESLSDINWALIAPLIGLDILLKIVAVIAWVRQRNEGDVSWIWLPVILFVNLVGPIIYFVFGRRDTY